MNQQQWILLRVFSESYVRTIREFFPHIATTGDDYIYVTVAAIPPGGMVPFSLADNVNGMENITHMLDNVVDGMVDIESEKLELLQYNTDDGTVRYRIIMLG